MNLTLTVCCFSQEQKQLTILSTTLVFLEPLLICSAGRRSPLPSLASTNISQIAEYHFELASHKSYNSNRLLKGRERFVLKQVLFLRMVLMIPHTIEKGKSASKAFGSIYLLEGEPGKHAGSQFRLQAGTTGRKINFCLFVSLII